MKKLTHSESEIVKSVNELEAGVSADEICRRLNVSRATLYQWKRKYGGLEVSQLKKLKELEEENAKLKKMYANLALDNEILREVIEKNSRAEWYYESTKDDSEVEAAIRQKAEVTNEGFWKIFRLIRKDGHPWNHKKVHRVYETIHFNKRKPLRKRLPARVKNPLVTPEQENITWSMDFVTDVLQSNRKFRVLNVIDDSDRVAVAQKVAHSIPAARLIRFMEEIIWEKGKPTNICCDNGPEFISHEFQDWCDGNGIKILYTQPGCPTQNSYIERFNGSYRRAVLDAYIFRTLDDVREITEKWTDYYNNERPHDSLNNLAPMEYRLMRTG